MVQKVYNTTWKRKRGKKKTLFRAAKRSKADTTAFSSHQQFDLTSQTKLGAQGSGYRDTSALSGYNWQEIAPGEGDRTSNDRKKRLLSLRETCCRSLSANASLLSSEMLKDVAQPCLLMLWKHILATGNDSIAVFTTFASILHCAKRFRCHESSSTNYQMHYISPQSSNYRLDSLFTNLDYAQFSLYMNTIRFDHLCVLDLGGAAVSKENLLLILKIKSLAALGLSNCNLDNNKTYYISSAISDGRLQNLMLLKINGNPNVTYDGLKHFFQVPETSALGLVLADVLYQPNFHSAFALKDDTEVPVEGTKWLLQKDSNNEVKQFIARPLGIQLQQIPKVFPHTLEPSMLNKLQNHIIWDFMMMEEEFHSATREDLFHLTDKKRLRARASSSYSVSCFTLDRSREIKTNQQHSGIKDSTQESESLFSRQSSIKKRAVQKRRKPKATNNVNDIVSIIWRS